MIPILFSKTETAFTSNGIGRLVDCLSCVVTEERNGIYELELEYPVTGKYYDELMQGGIIGVIHDDNHDIQPFDIYATSADIDGVVTVNAHHISYRLNNIILEPYTASTCANAVAGLSTHSVNTNPFSFSTDKTVTASFKIDRPKNIRSALMGEEGSLLDVYGTAEYRFDKFNVELLQHRGADSGVTVRYGKNLTGLDWNRDDSETYNAAAPYWSDGTDIVYVPEIIVTPTTPITPQKVAVVDMTDKFENKPTQAELRSQTVAYLDATQPWIPHDNIKIDFIALWQTSDYHDAGFNANVIDSGFTLEIDNGNYYLVADTLENDGTKNYIVLAAEDFMSIQRVGLCDTVSIYWTDLGIVSEKAKIVKVVYDVLAERFNEIEVGTVSNSYVAVSDGTASDPKIPAWLNSVVFNEFDIDASSTLAINVPSSSQHLIFGSGGGNSKFMVIVSCTSTGTVSVGSVYAGSGMSTSTSTNSLTISNGVAAQCRVCAITIHGAQVY